MCALSHLFLKIFSKKLKKAVNTFLIFQKIFSKIINYCVPQRLYHKLPRAERDPSRTKKRKSKSKRCNLLNDALRIFASASELQLREITKVVGKVLCKRLE